MLISIAYRLDNLKNTLIRQRSFSSMPYCRPKSQMYLREMSLRSPSLCSQCKKHWVSLSRRVQVNLQPMQLVGLTNLYNPLILDIFFFDDSIWHTLFFQFSSNPISYISFIFLITSSFVSPSGCNFNISSIFLSIETSYQNVGSKEDFLSLMIFWILEEMEVGLRPNYQESFCRRRLLKTAFEFMIFYNIYSSFFNHGFRLYFSIFSPCCDDQVLLLLDGQSNMPYVYLFFLNIYEYFWLCLHISITNYLNIRIQNS